MKVKMIKSMRTHEKIINSFQKNPLSSILQILGVAVVILNLWLVSKLSPIVTDISTINIRVSAIEEKTKDLVSHPEFSQIVTRLDHISNRVDELINIIANK